MSRLRLKLPLIDWLISLGLFSLALWLRMTDLSHFVTADEHNWVYRSSLFLQALWQNDWPGTSVWYTPAVITTWLGSGSLVIYYKLHAAALNQPLIEWLASFSRNKIDLDILLALRWSMVLFTSLMVAVVYGLARKLWTLPVALLGTLLLLTEPHLLAVSKIIGHDALLTFFTIASLLSWLHAKCLIPHIEYQTNPGIPQKIAQYRWFVLSGIFAGLAILSKAPAIILIPFAGLMVVTDSWQNKGRLKLWFWVLIMWSGGLWLTFILLWPAAWLNPWSQTWFVINTAFLSSAGLEDADIQPYWSIPNLGYLYYVVNGAFKMSPFLLIGTILAGFGGWHKFRRQKRSPAGVVNLELLWLLLFAILFGIMVTLGVKKSPRYILPAFPALTFVAAWGWLNLSTLPAITRRPVLRRFWNTGTIIVLGTLSLFLTLQYAPYYFTYFNPLLGGSLTAPNIVRVGWGEGLDELGRWLDARPDAPTEHVGARYTATLYPFYRGDISSPVSAELDYVAFYIKQTQSGYPAPEILAYFENQEMVHRVVLNGIEYIQVYQGPGMIPIQAEAGPDLPIAYRPHTIYAPIGGRLTIDLLWDADATARPIGDSINLGITSADASLVLESQAEIIAQTAQVRVSTHHFDLPANITRDTYTLLLDDKLFGRLKARKLDLPPDFEPLTVVMAGQLKLVGIRQRNEGHRLLVDLAWQGWPKATNDHTVYVQLLDNNRQRLTGVDIVPETGFTTLDRKEIMITHYDIPLPGDLQPDSYNVLVGLYYFAGDELINVDATTLEKAVVIE
jgi:hypothetical protein